MKSLVVLTQYKRQHLEKQLESIYSQTYIPNYVVVFQNESHVDISELKQKYNFIHIHSDYNTKYFGRFTACINFPVDVCIVMDDDIIPGKNCLKNYIMECIRLNGIMGGNGRCAYTTANPYGSNNRLAPFPEHGIRQETKLVDYIGHLWCFKKEWLYYCFSIKPYTFETSEDAHFCYSCKVKGNIKSYVCKQEIEEDDCDITHGGLACDKFSSYLTTSQNLRKQVETYFIDNYGLEIIQKKDVE